MIGQNSDFKIFKLSFPASAVFGESYIVATGLKKLSTVYKGEFFTLVTRNAQSLNESTLTYSNTQDFPQSDVVDIELMIEESKAEAELFFIDTIYELCKSNQNLNLYSSPISFVECEQSPFVSCWLRGHFHEEMKKIAVSTECEKLATYLNSVMRMSSFKITKR